MASHDPQSEAIPEVSPHSPVRASTKEQFSEMMAKVESLYDRLVSVPAFKCGGAPAHLAGKPGIYLLSEDGEALYVGRTDHLQRRLKGHRHRAHATATFAFLLARHETGVLQASYRTKGSRADLLESDPGFSEAFDHARERIGKMDVQTVEEEDAVLQALLEIYAACVSGAKFNDFANH
jgi:hypothetical protein